MSNIHEVNVTDENLYLELWQYDAGQKLKFVETSIADGSHVLFANSETRKAIRKEVANNEVGIPNKFLRATGKMHITIETFNENEETTLYEINGYIKRRQDGEPGTAPDDEPTFIQKIIQALNELKDKVENWFYTKSEVDNKDDFVLGEAKSYADGKDQDILGEAKGYTNTIALGLGNDLVVDLNTSTYVLTLTLKHGEETLATRSVDLPLESTVVSGRYDKTSKKLILTLVSGEVIEIPLGDLIDGLVSTDDLALALADYQLKITSSNKLDADLVSDEESENKFTNETEKAKWNAEATVFDAIYNNGQIVKTTSSYPNIKKNDLIIDTDVVNNPQTSVKMWRVKFTPSTTLELELLSGIVVIDDTPPTEQYGSSGIYTVDQIIFSKNGNFYRCATVTRGQENLYTYTWQTYDIKNKTRAYPAVVSGGQVSFLEADYPGIKAGDTIYYNTGGDSKNKQWIVVYTTTTLQVMDCEEIGFITGTPPTTVQAGGTQYMVDKIYFSDNGNIYRCLTRTPSTQTTGYDYTWQTLGGGGHKIVESQNDPPTTSSEYEVGDEWIKGGAEVFKCVAKNGTSLTWGNLSLNNYDDLVTQIIGGNA